MELLRDFLAFIDENFDTFSGLDIRNEEDFSIVSFSDIGEEKESGMCVFYPVSITFKDDSNVITIRISKHFDKDMEIDVLNKINSLNYENSLYTYYANKFDFVILRENFEAKSVEDIFNKYKEAMDKARVNFLWFKEDKKSLRPRPVYNLAD